MFLLAYGIHKGKDMMIYYTKKGQIIKLTFISCFLLPSFLVYEQPTNLQVSGKPIKFVGQGERIEDLEPFYPDRMAQRILGMGDVLSFVEKAQEVVSSIL